MDGELPSEPGEFSPDPKPDDEITDPLHLAVERAIGNMETKAGRLTRATKNTIQKQKELGLI